MLARAIEFFDNDFFQQQYLRLSPSPELRDVVDFYWQTTYSRQQECSVKTFARLGSTILINLGSGFHFNKGQRSSVIESNVLYRRNESITTTHRPGNVIFGVQVKAGNLIPRSTDATLEPVELKKELLSAYEHRSLRDNDQFCARAGIMDRFLLNFLNEKLAFRMGVINRVLQHFEGNLEKKYQAKDWQDIACCSSKTLERYFIECCGTTPKQAMKIVQVRNAARHFIMDRNSFDYYSYGYYDRSHFHKDLTAFLNR